MEQLLPEVVMPNCPVNKLLRGQVALVTGANSGIGRAVATALGHAGADVVVNYIVNSKEADEVCREIERCGSRSLAIQADVSREGQVSAMFSNAVATLGTVDILVNNAGIQRDAPFDEMTLEQWRQVIEVNLTGQFLCAREAIREFKRRGVKSAVSCSIPSEPFRDSWKRTTCRQLG